MVFLLICAETFLPVNRSLLWEAEILQMQVEKMTKMRTCPLDDNIHHPALIGRSLDKKQAWLSGEHQTLILCMFVE